MAKQVRSYEIEPLYIEIPMFPDKGYGGAADGYYMTNGNVIGNASDQTVYEREYDIKKYGINPKKVTGFSITTMLPSFYAEGTTGFPQHQFGTMKNSGAGTQTGKVWYDVGVTPSYSTLLNISATGGVNDIEGFSFHGIRAISFAEADNGKFWLKFTIYYSAAEYHSFKARPDLMLRFWMLPETDEVVDNMNGTTSDLS